MSTVQIQYNLREYIPIGKAVQVTLPLGTTAAEFTSNAVTITNIAGTTLIASGLNIATSGGTDNRTFLLVNNTGSIIQPLGLINIVAKMSRITATPSQTTSITYNADGTVNTYTVDGTTYTLAYTSGKVTTITYSTGEVTTITYDGSGRTISAITV